MNFDFGENWKNYSAKAITGEKVAEAKNSILQLLTLDQIKDKNIVDLGCGSGIFALSFLLLGAAKVVATDINEKCLTAARNNLNNFLKNNSGYDNIKDKLIFIKDDILDSKLQGEFDVVYSWGVLHHTGRMYQAIENAGKLVKSGGQLVLAIYNKHWTSPVWEKIKYIYNLSPLIIKKLLVWFFYVMIFAVKLIITGHNPLHKERGMSFYYDIIDWLGGYPYEYANLDEIKIFVEERGFFLKKIIKATMPTSCNEYIFVKS